MKETYTRDEVVNILVAMFIFSGANNNQGLRKITGTTYGQQAEHVLKCMNVAEKEGNTLISAVPMFSKDKI